jgi:DNA-directed RNA polymerase subunit RPC12/RpoP
MEFITCELNLLHCNVVRHSCNNKDDIKGQLAEIYTQDRYVKCHYCSSPVQVTSTVDTLQVRAHTHAQ